MAEKEPEFKPKRLNIRRWTRPCKDCGTIVVFLENPKGPVLGEKWSRWLLIEMFGVKNGEPAFWDGAVVYNPAVHVRHVCVRERRRIAWFIRNSQDDL